MLPTAPVLLQFYFALRISLPRACQIVLGISVRILHTIIKRKVLHLMISFYRAHKIQCTVFELHNTKTLSVNFW